MRAFYASLSFVLFFALASSCGSENLFDAQSHEQSQAIAFEDAQSRALLAFVNDAQTSVSILDHDAGIDSRAANNIVRRREQSGAFENIAALDAVSYVGKRALELMLDYALAHGYGGEVSVDESERALLALVNDLTLDVDFFDDTVGIDSRAAQNIIAERPFANEAALDAVSYVGKSVLARLRAFALENGYGILLSQSDAIFSPQLYPLSHNARIKTIIDQAQFTLDIAMYSFRDRSLIDAVVMAEQRGVSVRVLFESANADRRKPIEERERTRSAALEMAGADTRYVNKIMHHKFVIADGPRDFIERAETAIVASGSANWSQSAATLYDENTVFFTDEAALTLEMQREFEHLWVHSRDFIMHEPLPFEMGTSEITDEVIESFRSESKNARAYFTSDNFRIRGETTFSTVRGLNRVSDRLVKAIEDASDSIYIASGHFRSRPIAEALMAKRASSPEVDIRVYLDGQEFISHSSHARQNEELIECVERAGESETRREDCINRGFLFGVALSNAGIDVRYKHYSYRWHYTYAAQMHHKYLLIDGDELFTGSYNLSDNAEHNTFENMMRFKGAAYAPLIESYRDNFLALRETSRGDGTYEALLEQVREGDEFPIVYTPMSLNHDEVSVLKSLIRERCPEVMSEEWRRNPQRHRTCHVD